MPSQGHIVSFEEARAAAARRAGERRSRTGSLSLTGSAALSGAFDAPGDDAFDSTATRAIPETVSRKERREQKRRRRTKERADKAFAKAYEADAPASGGPRAAVYKGQMGAKQKRANRIQEKAGDVAAGLGGAVSSARGFDVRKLPRSISVLLGTLVCVAVFAALLYTPAQQYYQQMRERDRLAAEYAAVQERNDTLKGMVDTLQTDAGVEDKALADFGLVKEGESAGAVAGADLEDTLEFSANVVPGSVSAPDTWYSGVLDVVFGYSD